MSLQAAPNASAPKDYSTVTEGPGARITGEAMRMLQTRYALARSRCEGKDVLELGCGPALGLAYLARHARRAVGGDCTFTLVRDADVRTGAKLPLLCLDAHCLPFTEQSFDIVLLYEALYYLARPEDFLGECRRVLRPHGELIVSLPNPDWPGFNASPFSTRYFSAEELYELFGARGFAARVYGAFPSKPSTTAQRVRDRVRRLAVHGHLIPKTFKGKEKLKRLFYGPLLTIGNELVDERMPIESLFPIAPGENRTEYRVLYAVGRIPNGAAVPEAHLRSELIQSLPFIDAERL
jgi:SAM-dependent methyltransferase